MKTLSTSAKPFWRTLRFLCIGLLALTVLFGIQINSTNSGFITSALAQETPDSEPSEHDEDTTDDENDGSREQHTHGEKQDETDTPVPEEEEKTFEEKLDEALDAIKNPKSNEDLSQYFPPGLKRKFAEMESEAAKAGKQIDLVSNRYINNENLSTAYNNLESTIKDQIMQNPSLMTEGLETLALAQTGMRGYNAGGAARDFYGTSGAGRPGLSQSQQFSANALNNLNQLLSEDTPLAVNTGDISRLNIAKQQAYQWADYTSITQGNWGSCWTCTANAYLWAERPDIPSDVINQMLFTNQYRAGNGQLYNNWPIGNEPSKSNTSYNFSEGGEQSYAGRLMQQAIGTVSNDPYAWGGGNPGAASKAVGNMIGDSSYYVPNLNRIGGIAGLTNGINDGRYRTVQYIPFRGHSATQSGYLLPTTDGGFLGMGINDNSWGTRNEHAFLATAENAGKWVFPGGGGSRFGGPGFGEAMNGLLNGFQNLGNQQNQNAVQLQQMNQEKANDTYSKLTKEQKTLVRNICIQTIRPGIRPPNLCKPAVKDKSLPPLIAQNTTSSGTSSIQRSSIISSF
jgi:hypothetical protein